MSRLLLFTEEDVLTMMTFARRWDHDSQRLLDAAINRRVVNPFDLTETIEKMEQGFSADFLHFLRTGQLSLARERQIMDAAIGAAIKDITEIRAVDDQAVMDSLEERIGELRERDE